MTNVDSVLKSRGITLLTKVYLVKAMVFPVVMYGCEGWTIKKTEHWEIDAFELWCWRRLLRVPLTARRANQSILKEINPEYSLEDWYWSWSSNILAIWCKEPTHWKRPWGTQLGDWTTSVPVTMTLFKNPLCWKMFSSVAQLNLTLCDPMNCSIARPPYLSPTSGVHPNPCP